MHLILRDRFHYPTLWCLRPSTDLQLVNQHSGTCCHIARLRLCRTSQLALAQPHCHQIVPLPKPKACWVHRWSRQKDTQRQKRGDNRVQELMLTTDVYHSSLIALTLQLAHHQPLYRWTIRTIYIWIFDV